VTVVVADPQSERRVRARAQATAILDAPRVPRRYTRPQDAELDAPRRRRRHGPRPRVAAPRAIRVRHPRRVIAAAVLLTEVTVLVLALVLPAFQVRSVTVDGTRLLDARSVVRAAAVPHQSIFMVDADTVRARLVGLPWVASVSVVTELPDGVRISVVERAPLIRVRRGIADLLIAGNGATMKAPASTVRQWSAVPALIDDRPGSAKPVPGSLVQLLATVAQRFPAVFGGSVAAFEWGSDGVFAIWSSAGWRAVLGHLGTADAIAALPAQLAALAALRGELDLQHPAFGYVDLDNVATPSIGGIPGLPPEVLSVGSAAHARITSSAVAPPVATPTPQPSPSPLATPPPTSH